MNQQQNLQQKVGFATVPLLIEGSCLFKIEDQIAGGACATLLRTNLRFSEANTDKVSEAVSDVLKSSK